MFFLKINKKNLTKYGDRKRSLILNLIQTNEIIEASKMTNNKKRKNKSSNTGKPPLPIKRKLNNEVEDNTSKMEYQKSETTKSTYEECSINNEQNHNKVSFTYGIEKLDKNTTKYQSRDSGPFVVFAKKENIKEISLAKDLNKSGIVNIMNIYKINENLAKIIFKDISNANKVIDKNSILNYEFFIPEMYTTTYGIIRGIENEIEINELKENIKAEVAITSMERLKYFDQKTKTLNETTTIKIGFRSSYLPRRVVLYEGILKEVAFFLPRPMFCTNCVTYGHTKKKCKSKIKRCTICGDDQKLDDQHLCKGNNCRFCLDPHITNSKLCDERKTQIKIKNLMTTKKIAYRDAKKITMERLNTAQNIDSSIVNFPNLSYNTSRINNINKMNNILQKQKDQNSYLTNVLNQIKQKLSTQKPNDVGNDIILMEITAICHEMQETQSYAQVVEENIIETAKNQITIQN